MDIWQEHPLLFHYTGTQGLKGIFETKTLHATDYVFLNDSSEIVTLRPKLAELARAGVGRAYASLAKNPDKLAHMNKQGGIDSLVANDVKVIVNALYDVTLAKNYHSVISSRTSLPSAAIWIPTRSRMGCSASTMNLQN